MSGEGLATRRFQEATRGGRASARRAARSRGVEEEHLASVQRRRTFPTAGTQLIQLGAQRALFERILGADQAVKAPLPIRLLSHNPALQRLPAPLIGVGLRAEHVGG